MKTPLQSNVTPLQAIRRFCIQCVGNEPFQVSTCGGDKCLNGGCDKNGVCYFYKYRMGKGRPSVKLIRKMCLWCQVGSDQFVRECGEVEDNLGCSLHPYRMGKNPNMAGKQMSQSSLKNLRKVGSSIDV